MITFLTIVQFLVSAALVGVILLQKSEGGGLTTGGSPSGLMSARGAADFLTRTTAILAGAFIVLSITLAVLAAGRHSTRIDASLQKQAPVAPPITAPLPSAPVDANAAAPVQVIQLGNQTAPAKK
ncbi:preprotein translocase subunit SecG [Sphingomonas sp. LB-2]|uniref:preprotein translocase subunit SecG n=1 Tax=Sphingomonas caeni TaxID=2984949 RepID=UPI0022313EE3|nr:preprotein translocase subunit SecG [Sphingomonas caeni]MCW3848805.1 preprotein translocase subunit SecG [Sphingomonas caeni]